jgi:peptidoglycan hydrolase CwlO-like protein
MKRSASAFVVAMLAITLIVISLQPALANHNPAHTQRQINQLQNQINSLKQQVNTLKADVRDVTSEVFNCEVFNQSAPFTFSDGTVGYPLYERSTCAV